MAVGVRAGLALPVGGLGVNGPEHYAEAERLIQADDTPYGPHGVDVMSALVHAVLAVAAATIENDAEFGVTLEERRRWAAKLAVDVP
jgi:hypothetical protein